MVSADPVGDMSIAASIVSPKTLDSALQAAIASSATYEARLVSSDTYTPGPFEFSAADLADPGSGVPQRVLSRFADQIGLPDGRHATSIFFQRYAHRIAGIGVTGAAITQVLPDLNLATTSMIIEHKNPSYAVLQSSAIITDPSPTQVIAMVVSNHLEPIAAAWSQVHRMSYRGLVGNIAAALGKSVRRLEPFIGTEAALDYGTALADAHPDLGNLGNYLVLRSGRHTGLFYERRSCCQRHIERGRYCAWCALRTHEERVADFQAELEKRVIEG